MSTTASPHDRDIALMGGLAALAAALGLLGLVLQVAATLTAGLTTGIWSWAGVDTLVGAALSVLAHPGAPGAGLASPWAQTADHPVVFWTLTLVLTAAIATGVTLAGIPAWRRFGPTQAGHASREDIRAELSAAAARRTATWTRPSLSDIKRAPLEQLAVPLHRGPHGPRLWSPLENPTGAIAPTQSGKSRQDLVHKALAAPGALLCSTTKPDLFEFAALSRTRREDAGPVIVFDATGTVAWPALLRWSPISGCGDPDTARRRAETLVDASAVGLSTVGGNDKIFQGRAKTVLQAYLLAAALSGADVATLLGWGLTKPPDQAPVAVLREHGYPDLADNLRSEIGMVAETSDAVWMSVRRVLEPLLDPHLRDLCSPEADAEFDAHAFVREQGSLFLVAGEQQAAQARPILTALTEHVLTTMQELALTYPSKRLDPPATAVLDELATATPVPRLPGIIADSAGRGVLIHWAAQSLAQLEDLYETSGQRQLMDNTTTLSIFGGLKDQRSLEWISMLTGQHDRLRHQQQSDGLLGAGRTQIGTETVPTYRPGAIRTLKRGRVLVIHRNLLPILARTVDVSRRDDFAQLKADVATVRAGSATVDTSGYATTAVEEPV